MHLRMSCFSDALNTMSNVFFSKVKDIKEVVEKISMLHQTTTWDFCKGNIIISGIAYLYLGKENKLKKSYLDPNSPESGWRSI